MEAVGAFLDQEWESINRMLSTGEHANGFSFGNSPAFWPISDEATINFGPIDESLSQLIPNCDPFSTNLDHYFSQEISNSSSNDSVFIPTNHPSLENHNYGDPNHFHEPNYTLESTYLYSTDTVTGKKTSVPLFSDNAIQEIQCEKEEERRENLENEGRTRCKRLSPLLCMGKGEACEAPKKRTRASGDAPKGKKNVTSKTNQKRISLNEEEYINASIHGSGCCSSEDSIVSQELNGEETSESKSISALNSDGKMTTGRGAATDPQSLYARKRRERINERLRILQSLVPNGTKVDISTMLEEAVQYVKFLQLQIKILGSDDLWMYAPIAYNGMDMGLYQKIHHLNNAGSSCL